MAHGHISTNESFYTTRTDSYQQHFEHQDGPPHPCTWIKYVVKKTFCDDLKYRIPNFDHTDQTVGHEHSTALVFPPTTHPARPTDHLRTRGPTHYPNRIRHDTPSATGRTRLPRLTDKVANRRQRRDRPTAHERSTDPLTDWPTDRLT